MALHTEYSYTIQEVDNVCTIVLTQLNSGRTKEFQVTAVGKDRLTNHMEHLSDPCCEGFFPTKKKKK